MQVNVDIGGKAYFFFENTINAVSELTLPTSERFSSKRGMCYTVDPQTLLCNRFIITKTL